jgi:2-dehydro-3-deoxy-L-rhamnonate dehydrogenase (NAD+)
MPSLEGQRALVTGGTRGIGANIARELEGAGMDVVRIGQADGDVANRGDVERWAREAGDIDLLVCNAGIGNRAAWDMDPDAWWRVHEVNVLGVHLTCRAFLPGMLERGGRIVIVGSGSAYIPGIAETAYTSSKAAICRYGETLNNEVGDRVPVFVISPGMVRTDMTADRPDDSNWTPPECAPRLVHALATGELDRLAGRYLHAEHDPLDELRGRIDAILADDLNAIRLRR